MIIKVDLLNTIYICKIIYMKMENLSLTVNMKINMKLVVFVQIPNNNPLLKQNVDIIFVLNV